MKKITLFSFSAQQAKRAIISLYIVGVFGLVIPFFREWFVFSTPIVLVISVWLVARFHSSFLLKDVLAFLLVSLLGYFLEMYGVNTGFVFGHYTYGKTLGPSCCHTPFLIGLNWLFLTYASLSLAGALIKHKWAGVLLAPFIMLTYDIVLESLAPWMDMWHFEHLKVPWRNYVAWWIAGLVFSSIFAFFRINTRNSVAVVLLLCQFAFLLLLVVFKCLL